MEASNASPTDLRTKRFIDFSFGTSPPPRLPPREARVLATYERAGRQAVETNVCSYNSELPARLLPCRVRPLGPLPPLPLLCFNEHAKEAEIQLDLFCWNNAESIIVCFVWWLLFMARSRSGLARFRDRPKSENAGLRTLRNMTWSNVGVNSWDCSEFGR